MNALRSRRARPDDGGFALVTVLGVMLALSLLVLSGLAFATNAMPQSRRTQDGSAALAAAQAGIDDYLSLLNACDTYWQTPCDGTVNPALNPGPNGPNWKNTPNYTGPLTSPRQPQFQYSLDATPATVGKIQLRSTGRANGVARTVVADLRKPGLLKYIYYTDMESRDPQSLQDRYPTRSWYCGTGPGPACPLGYSGYRYDALTAVEAAKCDGYHYGTASSAARAGTPTQNTELTKDGVTWTPWSTVVPPPVCDLQFGSNDVIAGPLHTNDAMLVNGPVFQSKMTETSWPDGSTPAPPATGGRYWSNTGVGPQVPPGQLPVYAGPVKLPPTNSSIRDQAALGQPGCLYTGATRIVLRADGLMDVTSPGTTSSTTNPGCSTGGSMATTQTVPLPPNGVIYVQPLQGSATCTGKAVGIYPVTGDISPYNCAAGDLFVEGTLKGRLTMASYDDTYVTGNLTYAGGATGTDALGLIGNGTIRVYHPVKCTAQTAPADCTAHADVVAAHNVTINAAILSVAHSFTVQNFDLGSPQGTLYVFGGIYQKFRGPVGLSGSSVTGFVKSYTYDTRLAALPPPYFINPLSQPWDVTQFAEQSN